VTYIFGGEAMSFDIGDSDDLREVLMDAARELRSRHPELEGNAGLVALVADRILNCLAHNEEAIDLGTLP
jgi:hypothetical protein